MISFDLLLTIDDKLRSFIITMWIPDIHGLIITNLLQIIFFAKKKSYHKILFFNHKLIYGKIPPVYMIDRKLLLKIF